MSVKIYHNPRCSKSRATLALIEQSGQDIEIIEYLINPPTAEQIEAICLLLEREPLQIMRTGEDLFSELELSSTNQRSRADWIAIMVANPKLIERPIVLNKGRAVIGRPPENVLTIL